MQFKYDKILTQFINKLLYKYQREKISFLEKKIEALQAVEN